MFFSRIVRTALHNLQRVVLPFNHPLVALDILTELLLVSFFVDVLVNSIKFLPLSLVSALFVMISRIHDL